MEEGKPRGKVKRPDALRVEWRQNGSDDTDVMRARDAHSSG